MTYPALELLLQAYLTIDWPDDYPDGWAAVDDYIANEPSASISQKRLPIFWPTRRRRRLSVRSS